MNLYEDSKAEIVLKIKLATLRDLDGFRKKEFQQKLEAKLKDILEFAIPDCDAVVVAKLAGYAIGFIPIRIDAKDGEEPAVIFEGIEAVVLAIPRKKDD